MDAIALPEAAAGLLVDAQAHSARRAARTLCGGSGHALRQTVIALLAGASLSDHENPGEATLQVLEGQVRLTWSDGSVDLDAGRARRHPRGAPRPPRPHRCRRPPHGRQDLRA